jgi:SAM-dependent methyltransferase
MAGRRASLVNADRPAARGTVNQPSTAPSAWVKRFASLIRDGGTVLDLACGGGRHSRYLSALGYHVVAVDIDVSGVLDLSANENVEIIEADLEAGDWPFSDRRFDGIVVTNYLHRPHLPRLVESLSPGGVLIYETFAKGNEKLGRPRNPAFLLNPAELLDAFAPRLTIMAYEHAIEEEPTPAVRQRICAVNGSAMA